MNLVIANKDVSVLVNDSSINTNGSHLHGYIDCSYFDLIEKLGEPEEGCDKTRAEWTIQVTIEDQTVVATLYDWKEFQPIEYVSTWNIGGFTDDAVRLIRAIFPDKVVRGRGF